MDLVYCTMEYVRCEDDRIVGSQQCGRAMYWRGDEPVGGFYGAYVCDQCDMVDDVSIGIPWAGPPVIWSRDFVGAYWQPGWARELGGHQ